jgi:two-component system CheB/CheR fusion protein
VVNAKKGCLRVVDDGVGIGKGVRPQSGMGLEMMRWRAGLIGGSLDIRRTASAETMVACHFPVVAACVNSVVRKHQKTQ